MKKNFGVVGLGNFGSSIATTLEKLGQQVMAFDSSEEKVECVKDFCTVSGMLDSTDIKALENSGITACDTVIIGLGKNTEANFLTVLNLKELGIKTIIAKANSPAEGKILEKIGATKVVYPEKESAIRLANQLVSSDILEYIEVSPDYQVAEIEIPKNFINKKLEELNLIKRYRILVIAIKRQNKTIIVPTVNERLLEDDIIVIVGQTSDIVEFSMKYNSKN
jgi:trk system potassium uptake protein